MRVYELMEILSTAHAGAEVKVIKQISPEELAKTERVDDTKDIRIEADINDVCVDDTVFICLD